MKKIPLTQGKFALVDDEDYDWLSQWKWYFSKTGYAHRNESMPNGKQRTIRMHRLIVGAEKEESVDHINHNILDNQRHNLRRCTSGQNQYNSIGKRESKLGIKGVRIHSNKYYPIYSKFQSQIQINHHKMHLGYFDNIRDAVNAYNVAAKIHFGEFAYIVELDDATEMRLNKLLRDIIESHTLTT